MFRIGDSLSPAMTAGEERMETPGDVAVMLRLAELGWGSKRIADELGCSRTTVKRYLRQGGWASCRGRGRRSVMCVKFSKRGHGCGCGGACGERSSVIHRRGSRYFAHGLLLEFPQIFHVQVTVRFKPVLVGFDA